MIIKIICAQPEWDEMAVDEMSVDQMAADKMLCCQNSVPMGNVFCGTGLPSKWLWYQLYLLQYQKAVFPWDLYHKTYLQGL
jgi:hypothetical protein